MPSRIAVRVAWSLWILGVLLAALHLVLMSLGGLPQESERLGAVGGVFLRVLYSLTVVLLVTLGALIASRHPRNLIGWTCCVWGVLFGLEMFSSEYATSPALAAPGSLAIGAVWLAWLAEMLNINIVLLVPVLLLFPNGQLPSTRWRPVVWLLTASAVTAEVFLAIKPGALASAPSITNPLAVSGMDTILIVPYRLSVVGTVAAALLAAVSLALRLRRAKGDERQQLKWIAYAGVILVLTFFAGFSAPREWSGQVQTLYFVVLNGFLLTLGLAVLKYRLYDIDLVVNRTLVFAALAGVITLIYLAIVVGIGALIGSRGEPNLVLSLLATAVVALLFQPLRGRVQQLANQLVYGHRASPYEALSLFSRRMTDGLSTDDVLPRMAEAAARGVGAARARVRVYVPNGQDQVIAWPAESVGSTFDDTLPVLHQGTRVGEISVSKSVGEALSVAESALLADLAAQAGPALSNVRLTIELHARLAQLAEQADQLRASRQRIVAAQDTERRRLERDVHDGAQQHLVAIAVNARLARQVLDATPVRTGTLLDEISTQADEALETLRDLARGIFPAVLADRGLLPALRAQMAKSNALVQLDVDASIARARFDPGIETAVYFCCLEALQNTAKHAADAPVRVSLSVQDGWLAVQVSDQGPGFDASLGHTGTGLQGMVDRLAAVGGTLEVVSAVGQGTTVYGRVPLESAGEAGRDGFAAAHASASLAEPNSALLK